MNDDVLRIIEELKKRNISENEIDVAKIMMGMNPFETHGLSIDELRVKAIMGGTI